MFQKLKYYLRDYFAFNQTEIKGFIILMALIAILIVSIFIFDFLPNNTPSKLTVNPKRVEELMAKIEIKEAKENPFKGKGTLEYTSEKEENTSKRIIKYFQFDPNLATQNDLESLGMATWLAERIIKYRNKGGRFRKKEDLQRIYSFPTELYKSLEPYISIASLSNVASDVISKKNETFPDKNIPLITSPKESFKVAAFDLNRADTNDLKKLKGIASKRAMRIILEREKLGGFYSVEQVKSIWGLDSISVDELLKYGRVSNPQLRKIKINEVSLEELKHPYLRPYIAKIIIAYRQQHGSFSGRKDLENIKLLDAQTLDKLLPYLSF